MGLGKKQGTGNGILGLGISHFGVALALGAFYFAHTVGHQKSMCFFFWPDSSTIISHYCISSLLLKFFQIGPLIFKQMFIYWPFNYLVEF